MDFSASLFPLPFLFVGWLITGIAIAQALIRIKWREQRPEALHAWCGASVLALLLWLLQGGVSPGLHTICWG